MSNQEFKISESGLSESEAKRRLETYGPNEIIPQKKESFFKKLLHILAEPMFLLLIFAATIYFFLGEPLDGSIMLIFVVAIIAIDSFQEWKTDKTLNALKNLSAPQVVVIRDGQEKRIKSSEIVPGDVIFVSEGVKIPADGRLLKANDLKIDESSLTGESEGAFKYPFEGKDSTDYFRSDTAYAGTLVIQGSGLICVDKTGPLTEYGKIGKHIAEAPDRPTPLEKQTRKLVRFCAVLALILFLLVAFITYFNSSGLTVLEKAIDGILSGITLAMAMIPEEFPVILTVFLSMGAWRLARKNSLVRRLPAVETLGAVSVLCVDKTGTITKNEMTVSDVFASGSREELIEVMGLGCETDAYDPMEKAMLLFCEKNGITKEHLFSDELLKEYAFTNELKMMGHVWRHEGEIIVAVKGSPERVLTICNLSEAEKQKISMESLSLSQKGLRVIAVATKKFLENEEITDDIEKLSLRFLGLIGLYDPPRDDIDKDIACLKNAGVRVVMITGDNGITAGSIAKQIGMDNYSEMLTGDEIEALSEEELREKVKHISIFSRVVPEHKMRIVKAFKANGEVVAMTGDGVNDAPALKYSDIGIAMGMRGSEVSREAADLILMDDNFTTIVDTIRDGRRIYDNIKKAVGYVFSIHIPIALSSLIAPILKIPSTALLLLPLHVVLLELIIDPTCSIVLERQPSEHNIMNHPPRDPNESILPKSLLIKSIFQGLSIFAASFGSYLYFFLETKDENLSRSIGIAVIMLANLFLVQVNASDYDSILTSAKRLSHDKVMWGILFGTVLLITVILYTPLSGFLNLSPLSLKNMIYVIGVSLISVLWYELIKLYRRKKS